MRELLEKWSKLEPHLCKRETRPNKDWHEEFEDIFIKDGNGWKIVYIDGKGAYADKVKREGVMRVQYVVQQAIIEKGWWLEVNYTPSSGYSATITLPRNKVRKFSDNSMAEVLLAAYLEMVESSANP